MIAVVLTVLLQSGCASGPRPDQFFSTDELRDLVTDRSLDVQFWHSEPSGVVLYLARGGTGWLNNGPLLPGIPPQPSSISMVFNWRIDGGSRVCVWAAPRIGDVSSFVPTSFRCLQLLRSLDPPGALQATVEQAGISRNAWVTVYPFSVFPQPVIDDHLAQLKFLFGGRIPSWTLAEPVHTLQ